MENSFFTAFKRFKSAFNQMFTCLTQNLESNIFRHVIFFNKAAHEIEFSIAGTRKSNFNFFKTDFYKEIKKFQLLFNTHRIDESLISISQINRTPHWSFCNFFVRPCAVLQRHILKSTIFSVWIHNRHRIISSKNKKAHRLATGL